MLQTVICDLFGSTVFSTLPHHWQDLKKLLKIKCVFIFCTTFVWNISHSKKNWVRCDQKRILVFMKSTGYCCPTLQKLKFSQRNLNFLKRFPPPTKKNLWKDAKWEPSLSKRTDMMQVILAFHRFTNAPNAWMNFDVIC